MSSFKAIQLAKINLNKVLAITYQFKKLLKHEGSPVKSIRDFQMALSNIYANKDLSIDYMMVHFSTQCSLLSRRFNHNAHYYADTDHHIMQAIAWLIGMCSHFSIDLEDELINRFPGCCSYCLRERCICHETNKRAYDIRRPNKELTQEEVDIDLDMKRRAYRNAGRRISFDDFYTMIGSIYPANRLFIDRGFFSFALGKVDEEKGELHRAYSAYLRGEGKKQAICLEIGDVLAWLISFWSIGVKNKSIDDALWLRFSAGCPYCKTKECSCSRYSTGHTEEELIREIVFKLRYIQTNLTGYDSEIQPILNLADEIGRNDSVGLKKRFLTMVTGVADAAKNTAHVVGKIDRVLDDIGDAASSLSSMLP